ncbi:streptococcal 67 kDa myosin-cross-reactive antigen like family-domain-containing protein [Aspergillus unguis]
MDKHIAEIMLSIKQLPIRTVLLDLWRDPKNRSGLVAALLAAYLLIQRTLRYRRLKSLHRIYARYTTREQMATMTDHDAFEIQKQMLVKEFPSASLKALQFALFRTYGIPSISSLLLKTSQFSNAATSFKRYADTGALIGQFMAFDPASERAQTAIARTKYLHIGYRSSGKILESDMLYTLSLFALEPIRFIEEFEWRSLTELEKCAIGTYWKSLGDALEISFQELPSGPHGFQDGLVFLQELREWSLRYEEQYMQPNPTNKEVADKTMDVLVYSLPGWLKPVGVKMASCVMDERLREAMMYPRPSKPYRAFFKTFMAFRKFFLRHLALPRSHFNRIDIFTDEPNEFGRYYINVYEAVPYYVKPTLWNRWGPGAWVSWAMGMPLPGDEDDKYYPRGFDAEDLGPKYFEGKGRKTVGEIRETLKRERRGQAPFIKHNSSVDIYHAMPESKNVHAYILGSGIQSLTTAVHLLQEAHLPASQIHVIETLPIAGGLTENHGSAEEGYDFRAGVRPRLNGPAIDKFLSLVPSASDPSRTLRDEVLEHAESLNVKPGQTQVKFLKRKRNGVALVDRMRISLGVRDRLELFGLKPSHSAAGLHRYLECYPNLHDMTMPHPLDLCKYNAHESIVIPIANFLQNQGVDFRVNTTVTDIVFAYDNPDDPSEPTSIKAIHTAPTGELQSTASISSNQDTTINLEEDDLAFVSLGSVYSSTFTGTNESPPPAIDPSGLSTALDVNPSSPSRRCEPEIPPELDENWLLWLELSTKHPKFGNAYNFCTRMQASRLESFTITLSSTEFFDRLYEALDSHHEASTPLNLSITDHPWHLSLRVPPQPVFSCQPPEIQVCIGYGLCPEATGLYVQKPMLHCSGKEIFTEILSHFAFPLSILDSALTIPCIQPRAAATMLPRTTEDRPAVLPKGMTNMALIGPFVEIPGEIAVTSDYSVMGAQKAVRHLMGLDKEGDKNKVNGVNGTYGGIGRPKSRNRNGKGLFGR